MEFGVRVCLEFGRVRGGGVEGLLVCVERVFLDIGNWKEKLEFFGVWG